MRHPSGAQNAYYAEYGTENEDGHSRRARQSTTSRYQLSGREQSFLVHWTYHYVYIARSQCKENRFAYKVTNSSCPPRTSFAFLIDSRSSF